MTIADRVLQRLHKFANEVNAKRVLQQRQFHVRRKEKIVAIYCWDEADAEILYDWIRDKPAENFDEVFADCITSVRPDNAGSPNPP